MPIQDIQEIYLDYQSRTSVELLKILCREYWKINPLFKQSKIGFENNVNKNTSALIIGDRHFKQIINMNLYMTFQNIGQK